MLHETWHAVRAELLKVVRRPAHGLLLGLAGTLTLVFGYLIPYAWSARG